ncbi:MAG: LysM peptidoglycan-binding domain-containing protein [Roseburia sp.]|nr:LysM peptidoglycan-binding domain-containing protein [Roseburia sp.]
MGYFGLLRKAEYQIKLAPDMPEMMISFQFAEEIPEEGYETYLFNGSSMDETYQMEIRNVEDNSLIQTTDVNLCIERTDTISFEDIDGDGYLEMNIVYPTHWSGDDEIDVDHRAYWTWDREKNELVQGKGQTASNGEDVPEANSTFILVTVEQGDCLWNLAVEYYGDGRKWTEIYEWNQATIGDDPSLIYEGMILNLPWETDNQLFTIP